MTPLGRATAEHAGHVLARDRYPAHPASRAAYAAGYRDGWMGEVDRRFASISGPYAEGVLAAWEDSQ